MERVSFKIAKAIKEAGYPQDMEQVSYGYSINSFGYFDDPYDYDALYNYHRTHPGETINFDLMCRFEEGCEYCVAPTYIEVWLWLWREKKIYFGIESESYPHTGTCLNDYEDIPYLDPEEAIIAAIEYIVENNLIK